MESRKSMFQLASLAVGLFAFLDSISTITSSDVEVVRARLVGGHTNSTGRVEVSRNGSVWGTVCDWNWTDKEATVVCRQLGYKWGEAFNWASFGEGDGEGDGEMFLNNVRCTGTEKNIDECLHWVWGKHRCGPNETAGVACYNTPVEVVRARLVGGQTNTTGRVEVSRNGSVWGAVCYDRWTDREAHVVCRQLGYKWGELLRWDAFGKNWDAFGGDGAMFLYAVQCNGTEENIDQCQHPGWGKVHCQTTKVGASVTCFSKPVRLSRADNSHGVVEIMEDKWSVLCGEGFGNKEAQIVCFELGFQNGIALAMGSFNDIPTTYVRSNITCVGNESSILNCTYDKFRACQEDKFLNYAVVSCLNGSLSKEPKLKLEGSKETDMANQMGRVLIQRYGIWGRVCPDFWNDKDADVVCRHLGFTGGVAFTYTFSGYGLYTLGIVGCHGNESTLFDCPVSPVRCDGQVSFGDSGVLCYTVKKPALRMVGSGNTGHLEIIFDTFTGAICDIDLRVAMVACKQLGFLDGEPRSSLLSSIGATAVISSTDCGGSEFSIFMCRNSGWLKNINETCNDAHRIAGVVCYTNVRISDGQEDENTTEGKLKMYHHGGWVTVCADGFHDSDARLVCRELGFPYSKALEPGSFGREYYSDFVTDFNCTGSELSIALCPFNASGECVDKSSNYASVICSKFPIGNNEMYILPFDSFPATVVVKKHGMNGTICAEGWDHKDAGVLCRQLGYSGGGLSFEPQYSGSNTPIWMTNVDCHGNETRIQYCRFLETPTRGCLSNQMAARVYCFEGPGISGIQVRLVNGSEPSNGRVEILYGGTWGTYCVSKYRGWNSGARVVCQQLGFTDGQPTNSFYGAGTGPSWLYDVKCRGDEKSIWSCRSTGGFNVSLTSCPSDKEDARVFCTGRVYLVEIQNSRYGKVMIWSKDDYRLVCSDGFDDIAAKVVCRSAGFQNGISICCSAIGYDSTYIAYRDVRCTGSENSILDCSYVEDNTGCSSQKYASVACSDLPANGEYSLKLKSYNRGTISIRHLDIWGYICADGFDDADATVICREMGFKGGFAYLERFYGYESPHYLSIPWLTNVNCTGQEGYLGLCGNIRWGSVDQCNDGKPAISNLKQPAVFCYQNSGLTLNLAHGNNPLHGQVMFTIDNQTGYFCGSFNDSVATVVCRQMGFVSGISLLSNETSLRSVDFGVNEVACTGNERKLTDCTVRMRDKNLKLNVSAICQHNYRACSYNVYSHLWENDACFNGKKSLIVQCYSTDFHVRINPDYEKSMHNFHGYVEVNVGGVWGSVCNRGWTNKDAFVACKQMGYAGGYAYRPPKNSSNLILMDNVRCHGDEDSLLNCPYDKWAVTTGCDFYTKRAGVLCYNDTSNYARVLPSTLGPDGVQRRKEIRG